MERARILALIAEFVTELDSGADVSPTESAAFTDLGVDSLSLIDLLFALERRLGIEIPDEALSGISTVGDLVDYVIGRNAPAGQY